ncbi:TetR/AcrR family transcriptional regulator [Halosegnis marinus]|uniref:TetR/AcrR family transcriptional regulator n=1 Tax=Halosegnis marinus TaxID=3034023 RepID=A0ABD5ZKY4_9EURY|nr:TetR/AcrR family transcriptional regulator [Halosegnis sp. DT85]
MSFSEAERERIAERLLAAGRERFSRYGLSKTTVAELADDAGIATGTFYRFFDSKAGLYRAVLDAEGERVASEVLPPLSNDDPEAGLREFLDRVCTEIETNPLTRTLLVGDGYDDLLAATDAAEREAAREADLAFLTPFVERHADRLPDADAETVAGAIRAATFVTLHREEVGDRYPAVRDLLLDSVARGLVREAS